jgi:hypothetical protein
MYHPWTCYNAEVLYNYVVTYFITNKTTFDFIASLRAYGVINKIQNICTDS